MNKLIFILFLLFSSISQAAETVDRSIPTSTTVAMCSGYGGWEVGDLRRLDPSKGAITRLWLYSESPMTWTPEVRRWLDQNGTTFSTIYKHPTTISHPGTGWQSIQVVTPFYLQTGLNFVFAYYQCGSDSPSTHVKIGRASAFGQNTELANFAVQDGGNTSPALGVTQDTNPPIIDQDFDWPANLDGFGNSPSQSPFLTAADGIATSTGPWTADNNHDQTARLILYKQGFGAFGPGGVWQGVDLTNAEVTIRFKMNLSNLGSDTIRFWIQAAQLDHAIGHLHTYNMFVTDINFAAYNDDAWHIVTFILPTASGWTASGGKCCPGGVDYTGTMDKDLALTRVQNVHFMIGWGSNNPLGSVETDYIKVHR